MNYREEKCDVTLPMVAIFLDLNSLFWPRRPFQLFNDRRKLWATVLFLSAAMHRKDHGLLRSRNFVTMATWHNDFSSLLDYRHMDDLLHGRTLVVTAKSWLWTLNRGGCSVGVYVSILFYYYFGTLITGPLTGDRLKAVQLYVLFSFLIIV